MTVGTTADTVPLLNETGKEPTIMDIMCRKCGEPWEIDTLHDEAEESDTEFSEVYERFVRNGCEVLGSRCNTPSTETDRTFGLTRQDAMDALIDIMGDDVDGIASEMEDLFG